MDHFSGDTASDTEADTTTAVEEGGDSTDGVTVTLSSNVPDITSCQQKLYKGLIRQIRK